VTADFWPPHLRPGHPPICWSCHRPIPSVRPPGHYCSRPECRSYYISEYDRAYERGERRKTNNPKSEGMSEKDS
jgi:hypothetical protein